MHAAQAIDLRLARARLANRSLPLGAETGALHKKFRGAVQFLDQDRVLTKDIAAATAFLRGITSP